MYFAPTNTNRFNFEDCRFQQRHLPFSEAEALDAANDHSSGGNDNVLVKRTFCGASCVPINCYRDILGRITFEPHWSHFNFAALSGLFVYKTKYIALVVSSGVHRTKTVPN